ncbi:unnamed protein product, partial [Scytosiphon promiscuus]
TFVSISHFPTEPLLYDLKTVVHHISWSHQSGDVESQQGHYVTFVRTADDEWAHYNDSSVSIVSADKVLTSDVYLMSYAKRPVVGAA